MKTPIILASASDRRRQIMATLSVPFEIVVPDVVEVFYEYEPERTAIENSLRKNEACRDSHPDAGIISADTIIDFEGRCVTKPDSIAEATCLLQSFSGRRHEVITAVAFSSPITELRSVCVRSSVAFRKLSEADIQRYFAEVDPLDKAGAYDIDQHGEKIIESFTGSRTNIMGLPVDTVRLWLKEHAT